MKIKIRKRPVHDDTFLPHPERFPVAHLWRYSGRLSAHHYKLGCPFYGAYDGLFQADF